MSVVGALKCSRPGCDGDVEDGYCTFCGQAMAPSEVRVAASASVIAAAGASGSTRTGSSPSTRSTRCSRSARSARTGSARTGSQRYGGLLVRPTVVAEPPETRLISRTVPSAKRFCQCGQHLTLDKGFCPKCGQVYSFLPGLKPGDLVLGKYEVKGTIAFGGLGWIYLAFDQLLRRYVVLKGILNSQDPSLLAVAVREREFLASVDHPNIVKVFDFINPDGQGYIVMEFVNGRTLMQLRKERNAPLPTAEACSYIYGVLPAFAYLDEHDLIYNDFKPDNVMLTATGVKLVDLGAVRRVDDVDADIYATDGYSAPEAVENPSPLADLYTVARSLAVLVAQFDFRGKFKHYLPPPSECPVFAQNESLYRFLLKATRPDPNQRFQTAEEMAEQLLGVMRELALGEPDVDLGPVESPLFVEEAIASDVTGLSTRAGRAAIPSLKVDSTDPAARVVASASRVPDRAKRKALLEHSRAEFPQSQELPLRFAGELIWEGQFREAEKVLADVRARDPRDWRATWLDGRCALEEGRIDKARQRFETVVSELPGELAPKLALGVCAEMAGDLDRARVYYDHVSRIDPSLTAAAFGLGRILLKKKDRKGAVDAYRRVPATSGQYSQALIAVARSLLDTTIGPTGREEIVAAGEAVDTLRALLGDAKDVQKLAAEVCRAAIPELESGRIAGDARETLFGGVSLTTASLRAEAERALRAFAKFTPSFRERLKVVDEANAIRPLTLI